MRSAAALLRRLGADSAGATLVEFGLVLLPMCILLIGGLELAYDSLVRTTLQGALNEAARHATVENPDFSAYAGDTTEDKIENGIGDIIGTMADGADVQVEQTSFFDFSDIGNPEKLMTDKNGNGEYDADQDDCFQDANDNGVFDTDTGADDGGGANDVVFYEATVTMPRLFPLHRFLDVSEDMQIRVETAVRNQPYANRPTPAVLCGV